MPVSLASRIYLFSISFRINIGNSVSAVAAVLPPDQPRVHPLALLDYQVEPLFIYLNLKGRGLLWLQSSLFATCEDVANKVRARTQGARRAQIRPVLML